MNKKIVLICPTCGKSDWEKEVVTDDGVYFACATCGALSMLEEMSAEVVESELRDDLLFTLGYTAGNLEHMESGFEIPGDVEGQHEASKYAAELADQWLIDPGVAPPFDLYAEAGLQEKYGQKN